MFIKKLTEEIEAAQGSENRKKENEDSAITIADQHAMHQRPPKSLDELKGLHDRNTLLQLGTGQASSPGLKAYEAG